MMASNPFNALMDPAQVGASWQNAFQAGMDRSKQVQTDQAIYDYVSNPSQESASNIARFDPRAGYQVMQQEQQRQAAAEKQAAEARHRDLLAKAAQGDKPALAELAGIDLPSWNTLHTAQKQEIDARINFIGNAALRISQLPTVQEQAAAWDQAVDQGSQQFPELAQLKGQYSPQALQSAIDHAGMAEKFLSLERPSYMSPQPGSPMVNVRDPNAVNSYNQWVSGGMQGQPQTQTQQAPPAQPHPNFTQVLSPQQFAQAFQGIPPQAAAETAAKAGTVVKVSSPQEALQLPSGTWILLPDNTYGRVP